MSRYTKRQPRRSMIPRRVWLVLVLLAIVTIAGIGLSRHVYYQDLYAVSSSQQTQIITIKKGSTLKQIATQLEEAKLIRSAWAFQLYVHRKQLTDQLQAGTYALSPSQDTAEIVTTLTKGKVATRLVTILPGRRIDQVRADLINDGFDPDAVAAALQPSRYSDLPVMTYAPTGVATLEGLLWPDSYQREPDTDPAVIIRTALLAMGEKITPEVQAGFAAHGLTVYQGLIVTSIVVQEVNTPNDQAQAAQVFLSRLKEGSRLGSDVTAQYGAIAAGLAPSLTYDSLYNTLQRGGLPPTPISTISSSSLNATLNPATTDWRYFVAGDDGTTYFSKTNAEHEALTAKYCHKLCGN